MTAGVGVNWLPRLLIGPGIWAAGFATVYALHGLGCALGWNMQEVGFATLHRLAMIAAWLVSMVACLWVLVRLPRGTDLSRRLPRIGAWIGLAATLFTLVPLLVATSC